MLSPELGPYLFDTSAEQWFTRGIPERNAWIEAYLRRHPMHVSSMTVYERCRGFAMLARKLEGTPGAIRAVSDQERYLENPGFVLPVTAKIASMAAELTALAPFPPSPRSRAHRMAESKSDRQARWRFDIFIAATALTHKLLLIHNNPADFEAIRTAIELSKGRISKLGPLQLMRCESACG